MQFVVQPSRRERLGEFLIENLGRPWSSFRAAIAFVKQSGTKHIAESLASFSRRAKTEIIAGIDLCGTSQEGLKQLLDSVGEDGRVLIFHNPGTLTFHPKVYCFSADDHAEVLVGSGNLTAGGLYNNYEASIRAQLDLGIAKDRAFFESITTVLDKWSNTSTGNTRLLDEDLLSKLVARGLVPVEALAVPDTKEPERSRGGDGESDEPLFRTTAEPRAPMAARAPGASGSATPRSRAADDQTPAVTHPGTSGVRGFVMTLQRTDVGTGQTTRGAARRSPEIFVPLGARDAHPEFWGWDEKFTEDRSRPGKFDRAGVRMRLGTQIINVNMMTWPVKHDFRLRSENLRSAGEVGDIIRIELPPPASGYDYYVEVIPAGTSQYPVYFARCTERVRNSARRYGYY